MADPRAWLPMNQMPIGDQRSIVVELRGADGEHGFGYFTGSIWAVAPITNIPAPLPFVPIAHRAAGKALQKLIARRASITRRYDAQMKHVRRAQRAARKAEARAREINKPYGAILNAIHDQAAKENRCTWCLIDLDMPAAASGAEDGMCGPCAEVPF